MLIHTVLIFQNILYRLVRYLSFSNKYLTNNLSSELTTNKGTATLPELTSSGNVLVPFCKSRRKCCAMSIPYKMLYGFDWGINSCRSFLLQTQNSIVQRVHVTCGKQGAYAQFIGSFTVRWDGVRMQLSRFSLRFSHFVCCTA